MGKHSSIVHGIPAGYRKGCSCAPCLEAWAKYQKDWQTRNRRKRAIRYDMVTLADRKKGITTIEEKRAAQKSKENSND